MSVTYSFRALYTLNASKEESLLVGSWTRFEGRTLLYFFYLCFSAMSTTLQIHTHLAQLSSCSSNFWLICPCVTCQGSKLPSSNPQWPCEIFFCLSEKTPLVVWKSRIHLLGLLHLMPHCVSKSARVLIIITPACFSFPSSPPAKTQRHLRWGSLLPK